MCMHTPCCQKYGQISWEPKGYQTVSACVFVSLTLGLPVDVLASMWASLARSTVFMSLKLIFPWQNESSLTDSLIQIPRPNPVSPRSGLFPIPVVARAGSCPGPWVTGWTHLFSRSEEGADSLGGGVDRNLCPHAEAQREQWHWLKSHSYSAAGLAFGPIQIFRPFRSLPCHLTLFLLSQSGEKTTYVMSSRGHSMCKLSSYHALCVVQSQ